MDASDLLVVVLLGVVLVLVAVAIAVVVRLSQRRRREQGLADRARTTDPMAHGPLTSDPLRLKPGDVVRFRGEAPVVDWVVRGTLAMDEDGYSWKEHLLDGSTAAGELRRWLSVEQGEGGLELALWDRLPGSDLTPDAKEVAHDGVAYRRDERGRARYSSTGTTGAAASGEMDYADYLPAAGGVQRLSFERFSAGGSWEVSSGRLLNLESLDILHS
jgi:hypothetical protein